jgi:hypothetical protein
MPTRRLACMIVFAALTLIPACRRKENAPAPAPSATKTPAANSAPAPAPAPGASTPAPSTSEGTAWKGFRPEDGPVVTGKAVSFASLSPSEQTYGVAPARGEGVVYQDQVQLIEHGDRVIRAANGDGLTWTLDGTDPRIAALKLGDIVFATSSCVGRILKLTRTGDDVQVILGPAQITDIIKKGNFAYDAPLDLNSLRVVEEPNFPGAFGSPYYAQMKQAAGRSGAADAESAGSRTDLVIDHVQYFVVSSGVWRPMRSVSPGSMSALALADAHAAGPAVVRTSYVRQLPNNQFNDILSATACYTDCSGLGVKLTANKVGLRIDISAVLRLETPRFSFNFNIGGPGPQAQVTLTGGAGFLMTVEGQTDPKFTSNLNEIGAIPVDLNLPLQFGPLPLVLHYHQDLSLSSAFSAKTSILRARADLRLRGTLGFIYQGGGDFEPSKMYATPNVDPSHEINGISMGINSIVVGISQRLLMGLGLDGFAVGPYVSLTTTATALKQATEASHLMLAQPAVGDCTQATLQMQVDGGIGDTMPPIIVAAVNFFLKLVHATPISANGTLAKFKAPFQVMRPERYQLPDGCAGGAGK